MYTMLSFPGLPWHMYLQDSQCMNVALLLRIFLLDMMCTMNHRLENMTLADS